MEIYNLFFALSLSVSGINVVGNIFDIKPITYVADNWYRYDAAPVFFASIAIFLFFINVKFRDNKISILLKKMIAFMSPLTFGVYLIHDHSDMRQWIWGFLHLQNFVNKMWFPLLQIGVVLMIFVVCISIDWIRKLIFTPIEKSKLVVGSCNKVMVLLEKAVGRIIHD